ncbi:MAG: hypothetical protein WCI43_05305 [Candidatus Firestonebacteria bacterium]
MKKLIFILAALALGLTLYLSPVARSYVLGFAVKLGLVHHPEVKKCQFCKNGYITCPSCGGNGEAIYAACSVCGKKCRIDSYSKKTGLSGYYCGGCKKLYKNEYVFCSECGGSGHIKCDKCKGLGIVLN